ncbi:MAG: hypothetical protein U5R31_04610 [Acidimicrobiia bacterium]|nr:hypothetical protein [Acidimicrobiia bacterium]
MTTADHQEHARRDDEEQLERDQTAVAGRPPDRRCEREDGERRGREDETAVGDGRIIGEHARRPERRHRRQVREVGTDPLGPERDARALELLVVGTLPVHQRPRPLLDDRGLGVRVVPGRVGRPIEDELHLGNQRRADEDGDRQDRPGREHHPSRDAGDQGQEESRDDGAGEVDGCGPHPGLTVDRVVGEHRHTHRYRGGPAVDDDVASQPAAPGRPGHRVGGAVGSFRPGAADGVGSVPPVHAASLPADVGRLPVAASP